jgi:hypothetical protein
LSRPFLFARGRHVRRDEVIAHTVGVFHLIRVLMR